MIHRSPTSVWEEARRPSGRNLGSTSTQTFLLLRPLASSISHDYTISIVQGAMTVTMDGSQVFSGSVSVPPVAYLYVTASTGGSGKTPSSTI